MFLHKIFSKYFYLTKIVSSNNILGILNFSNIAKIISLHQRWPILSSHWNFITSLLTNLFCRICSRHHRWGRSLLGRVSYMICDTLNCYNATQTCTLQNISTWHDLFNFLKNICVCNNPEFLECYRTSMRYPNQHNQCSFWKICIIPDLIGTTLSSFYNVTQTIELS